jgi:hypothetical protein
MYVASSFEDWKQRGIQMFNEQNYDMAIVCFERARDSNMAKWAKAASLRQSGQRLLELNPESAKSLLREAAEIFLSIGKSESAANCYIALGEYKTAGMIYEEKCGDARLETAGDCFAEAKCWDNAAGAYARANCVSKCLDVCLKGKLFMIGLEFIEVWKKHNCNTNCGRCHGCEMVKVETDYLKKCATYYHQKKDTKSMMKFVNALPSLDVIRSFLLRRDYFQELLGVEAAAGNFEKAADIAELKGDLLLEAEMHEKAGQYGLAVKSILFHVQLNSFWRTGNKGWPLQEFPEKNQLLKKVKDIAEKDQTHAYESLQCEGSILSDELYSLPQLTEHMIHAKKMRNIRLEIFSLRKVIDALLNSDSKLFHLGQGMSLVRVDDYSRMLLENKISPTILFFVWDEWKDKLLSSVNALSRYQKRRETEEDICYLEYALEYFGVRKNKNDRFCNAFNSEAFWLKGIDVEFLQRRGNTMQISIQNFFMSAKKFFTMDLYSVGKNVIEKLENLFSLCMRQNCILPKQGALLVQMYKVSESLKNMELLTGKSELQQVAKFGVVKVCKERFFDVFFPLKHQDENMNEFISLREDAASILILQDITNDIVCNMQRSITFGQIGRLQVLLPFLPKDLGTEYGKKIINQCLDYKHFWSDQLLWLDMDTFPEISLQDRRMHLVESFRQALFSTFNKWEKIDYISPHIFLVLLDKLFFLASSCEQLFTGLFLPRSFFIEFMTGRQGEFSRTWLVQSQSQLRCEGSCENSYVLLSHIIRHLLSDKNGTVEWIETSNIDSKMYFPELVLHLIIIICLICINSAGNRSDYIQLLWEIFQDSQITKNLPFKFREGLLQLLGKCSSSRKTFLINLSKAMRDIDNPLLMINLSKSHESIHNHGDIIILTEESLVCKESVLRAVLQEKDVYVGNERNEDNKNHDLFKHVEKDLSSSSSKSSISNTRHVHESVATKETAMSNTTETKEQQKVDDVGTEMNTTSENILVPLFEDDEPSHELKVNGWHVPWFVVWRMKRWLCLARKKLEEQIPLKDKYTEEALKVFQGKENESYMEKFVSKACPLKAEVDEYMDLIITTIPKVNQGHIRFNLDIDILHDIHDELQKLSELLDPRHPKHEDCDIEWLTNDAIDRTSLKLQESRERLKPVFDLIVDDSQKQKAVVDSTVQQVTETKSKQKKKKRPKGQKKKSK